MKKNIALVVFHNNYVYGSFWLLQILFSFIFLTTSLQANDCGLYCKIIPRNSPIPYSSLLARIGEIKDSFWFHVIMSPYACRHSSPGSLNLYSTNNHWSTLSLMITYLLSSSSSWTAISTRPSSIGLPLSSTQIPPPKKRCNSTCSFPVNLCCPVKERNNRVLDEFGGRLLAPQLGPIVNQHFQHTNQQLFPVT